MTSVSSQPVERGEKVKGGRKNGSDQELIGERCEGRWKGKGGGKKRKFGFEKTNP